MEPLDGGTNQTISQDERSNISSNNMSIDKLLPALLECFGIILCGYIAGRTRIITTSQAKGLGNFVSKFALPALLFKNMVRLDFGNVIWPFLWSVLIAKGSVFFIVCILTLIVASPDNRFSKAGIFSIFATQSNDFALGYPIVEALYRNTHPEYLDYIYLVAPVSLMILNPLGFALCEVQKWKNQGNQQGSKLLILGVVFLQVLKNPIVFMVIIGIGANFLLRQKIPPFMVEFVDGLSNSFGGAALFYLGLTMVGQLGKLTKTTVVTLILLTTAKLLLMPLICRDLVNLLDTTNTSTLNHSSLSNYAFLYGLFPTAPSVGIYAVYYNVELGVVTSGLVISTLLSAPIMYVSAWLLTIPTMDPQRLMNALQSVGFDISIVSLVFLVWTIAVMFLSKKYKRVPHMFAVNLFLAQMLTCVGMIIWNFVVNSNNFIGKVVTFAMLCTSLFSTYTWPGLIALSLVRLQRDQLKEFVFVIAGWGVPALATALLLIFGNMMTDMFDEFHFYSRSQMICSTVLTALSALLAGGSLVCLSRESWTHVGSSEGSTAGGSADEVVSESHLLIEPSPPAGNKECLLCDCSPAKPVPDTIIETPPDVIDHCDSRCESRDCLLVQEELSEAEDRQVARHVLLCLLLTVGLIANLSSCLWLLLNQTPGRLYTELQFFCAVTNFGQGLLSFALFGLDKHFIILPFKRRLSRLWSRRSDDQPQSDLPEEVRMTCTQFRKYHKDQCCRDIVRKRRCGRSKAVDCFLGCDLVQWLQRVGLAQDPGEAVLYGARLQQGLVLQHITQECDFQDAQLHYRFTP